MRTFFCLLAVTCVLGLAPQARSEVLTPTTRPSINQRALKRLGWKLSCQAWTFRDLTLFETLDTLHNLGIHYIEMFPGQRYSPDNPVAFDHNSSVQMDTALLRKMKEDDVTPVSYGVVGLNNNEADDRKVFDFAKRMRLLNIVSEPSFDSYNLLDRLTKEYKINVAIHDHPKPDPYWNPDTVLRVIAGHSKRIGACADTGHWYRSGLNPVDCLKKLKGHIIELHFKDIKDVNGNMLDQPWGTGASDAAGQLRVMKNQHFHGVFSIEYESTSGQTLVDNVAKCCQFFSDTATRLAASK